MMSARLIKLYRVVILFVLVLTAAVYGKVVVCPDCGWDIPDGESICSHCGAKVSISSSVSTNKESLDPEPKRTRTPVTSDGDGYLAPQVVLDEIKAGESQAKGGHGEVASLFFHNAMALETLTDPGGKGKRSKKILGDLKNCRSSIGGTMVTCSVCGGKGKRIMIVNTLSGEQKEQEVAGSKCQLCKGTGKVFKKATISEMKYQLGLAEKEYEMLQTSRRYVPIGGAWVPETISETLTTRQQVALKRATAAPCPACLGFGREDCKKCDGTGRIKCTNPECNMGMVKVTSGGKLTDKELVRVEKCSVCRGKGYLYCDACDGRGSVICRKCQGTGQRPMCKRCSGQGLITCKKCKGSGMVDEEKCEACGGEGVVECPTCKGEGRR